MIQPGKDGVSSKGCLETDESKVWMNKGAEAEPPWEQNKY